MIPLLHLDTSLGLGSHALLGIWTSLGLAVTRDSSLGSRISLLMLRFVDFSLPSLWSSKTRRATSGGIHRCTQSRRQTTNGTR